MSQPAAWAMMGAEPRHGLPQGVVDVNAVECLQRGGTRESGATVRAVFLHTGWRSGGTWLWSQCRDRPGVCGLYEPLHEGNADLKEAGIAALRPGAWHSSHEETAPYFEEYRGLLGPRGRGVAGFERRFAFERFFLEPEAEDAALEGYLRGLVEGHARRAVVLKFCRSLGRVGWLERRFPDAVHAVVLRRPLAQWRSCERLLADQRNRYFTVAPVLVLARNAAHPWVAEVCGALGVGLPALHSGDLAYGMETVWRHVRRQDAADRYRGFLAYWTVTALAALHSRAMVVETARLAAGAGDRAAVEAALGAGIGARLELEARAEPMRGLEGPDWGDMAAAHAAAAECVVALGEGLAAGRRDVLLAHLAEAGAVRARARARVVPGVMGRRGVMRRAHTAVMVGWARVLQPVRRVHGGWVRGRTEG